MPLLCVIPARIGSTRLAEKPLRKIAGVPLITLVVRRVLSMQLEGTVVVATDDERIARLRSEIGREVDEATDAAENAPFPDAATFDRHVYADR